MRNLGEFEPLSKAAPPREAQPWSLVKSSVKTTRLPELRAVSSGEECWLLGEFNALKLLFLKLLEVSMILALGTELGTFRDLILLVPQGGWAGMGME